MIERIGIQNGDMVSMVKIVNDNTIALNNRIRNGQKINDNRMRNVAEGFNILANQVKANRKSLTRLGICLLGCEVFLYFQERKISKLEKKIKKLEDEMVVDKYLEKKDEEFDFLK